MARPYRLEAEDCLYHITSRGDDRKRIYISKYDYEKFIEYLLEAKLRFKFFLYAYCLIPNHYHLLIETTQANLSRIMQYINTSYTTYYNKKRARRGHLFQGRYKSIVVDKDSYFLELTRYIHLNPVKAKIVTEPEKYKWSSFRGYMCAEKDKLIDRQEIEKYYKIIPPKYRNFVQEGINRKENIFDKVYAGFILGREEFVKSILKGLKDQSERENVAYRRRLYNDVDIKDLVSKVAEKYKLSLDDIRNARKKPMLAKKVGIYLSKKLTSLTNKEIGRFFNISYSAISKAALDTQQLMSNNKRIRRDVEEMISHFKA